MDFRPMIQGVLIKDLLPVYGLSEKTLRRYGNEEGVDIWDPMAVGDHVATKQRPPRGYVGLEQSQINMAALTSGDNVERPEQDRKRRPMNEDVLPGVAGTLQRLESAEPGLFDEWMRTRSGNLAAAKQAHTLWNATAKTLLDYDLKLDAARKELGEMVAIGLMNDLFVILAERLTWAAKHHALELFSKLRPMLKDDIHPDEITSEFLAAPLNAIREARMYYQDEESVRPVVHGFLDSLKSHLVIDEDD